MEHDDQYCNNIFQVIDLMQNAIKERFDSEASVVLRGLGQLHPKRLCSDDKKSSIQTTLKAVAFYDIDTVKVETEIRLLCTSQPGLRSRPKYEVAPAPAPEHIPIKI